MNVQQLVGLFVQQPVEQTPSIPRGNNIAIKLSLPSIKEIEKELGSNK